jgi:hypothetical protein
MKQPFLPICILVFLLLSTNGVQAQTTQTESLKARSEYNVLDAWSGIWNIQLEARDSISTPYYHVDWILKGQRILNGYALEIFHLWKTKDFTQNLVEITCYDPINKICLTHIFYDNGCWEYSKPKFIDKSTCIEEGTTYFPNGKVNIWRNTWNFSDDWMSLVVKCENYNDNIWWIASEGKGTKSK